MEYASQRLERHIRVRSISSPEDICLTTRSLLSQVVYTNLNDHIHKHIALVEDYKVECEAIRKRNEQELLSTGNKGVGASRDTNKGKAKKEQQKEATRNANKAKTEEKRRREEFERQSAIAWANKVEAQKKKAREIAIKKKKALLAQADKMSETSK